MCIDLVVCLYAFPHYICDVQDTCWFLASIRHKYPSVSVQCDNCSKEVGRVWYVDLDSDSHNDNLDLCSDCFKSKYSL